MTKRSVLIFALAIALVFAFAAIAQARPNGNIYIPWSATGSNASTPTPHAGYSTATEKCAVCHSVHYAATSGFSWDGASGASTDATRAWTADSTDTQMLLRSSVANACNYCHIQTSIGGVQLYGGTVAKYTTGSSFAHNSPSAACSGCHAVHGANTFQGANTTKILRVRADRPVQPEVLADGAGRNPDIASLFADLDAAKSSSNKYLQQVAFCTQCHAEYTDASESTITGGPGYYTNDDGVSNSGDEYTGEYKGHPLKSADASWENTAAGGNFMGQVAWTGSNTCRSCHDAGNVDEVAPVTTNNSFPHYTQGYSFFSTWGGSVADTQAADFARTGSTDGNCLKCHINAGKTEGVGITF